MSISTSLIQQTLLRVTAAAWGLQSPKAAINAAVLQGRGVSGASRKTLGFAISY